MPTDWTGVFTSLFPDNGCPTGHAFPKHVEDGSVWCPDCGQTIRPDTFLEDFPGIFED